MRRLALKMVLIFIFEKNQIGSFYEAKFTIVDLLFLRTLPEEEWKNGYAEYLKHCFLMDDNPNLYPELTEIGPSDILASARFKESVVRQDPYDHARRQILNFGHTIGHAIEALAAAQNLKLSHGDAVLIGICAEIYLSSKYFDWPPDMHAQCQEILVRLLPDDLFGINPTDAIPFLFSDKKRQKDDHVFSLLRAPGDPIWGVSVTLDHISESLAFLKNVKTFVLANSNDT